VASFLLENKIQGLEKECWSNRVEFKDCGGGVGEDGGAKQTVRSEIVRGGGAAGGFGDNHDEGTNGHSSRMGGQSRGCVRGKELEDRCAERAESEGCAGEGIGELFH